MPDSPNKTTDQVAIALKRMEDDDGYFTYGAIAWDALTSGQREQLKQLLYQGPVWDGNIISKSCRDQLIGWGLATQCCFLGEQGYTAATYTAYSVAKQGRATPLPRKPGTPG
jgi:hypothetical protein